MKLPDLDIDPTLGAAIRHRAATTPDTDFLVSEDDRWSYGQIEAASARVARRMLAKGIGKGTRVGLYFTYGPEWVICWLAASRIGALVIPLSTIYAPLELGRVLKLSDISVLIAPATLLSRSVSDAFETALPGLAAADGPDLRLAEAPFLRQIWMTDAADRPWAEHFDLTAEPAATDPDAALLAAVEEEVVSSDPAVVVFTSGSSALPKGVVHTHGSIIYQSSMLPGLMQARSGDLPAKIICGMPFFWVGGILTLAGSMLGPIPLMIMERFDPVTAMTLIEREKATVLMGWPTLQQKIVNHPDFDRFDLSSAPSITSGIDTAMTNIPVPGVPVHRGMSETLGSFACVETKVIDPDTGDTVAWGEDGELCVRGPGVMDAYYKKPRSEAFDADGWFHSGDKVFQLEGDPRSFYRGRYTEMIKTSGANVAPREVEAAIEEFEDVVHCLVFGVPDEDQGEAVLAVVAQKSGARPDKADMTRRARLTLSGYKVPKHWVFVSEETIPWLGSGKADKLRLRAMLPELTGRSAA
ncbi:hypothetical protein ATO6_19795 [Oceanicola sp. 22II-s10i]|nr:hypothetical protein ATO6_19795 [Oceanicola sp. 22II-s10i]